MRPEEARAWIASWADWFLTFFDDGVAVVASLSILACYCFCQAVIFGRRVSFVQRISVAIGPFIVFLSLRLIAVLLLKPLDVTRLSTTDLAVAAVVMMVSAIELFGENLSSRPERFESGRAAEHSEQLPQEGITLD